MAYVATINVPGYLPMDDDPPTFDHAWEAWAYLASEREEGEDSAETEGDTYSETHEILAALGTEAYWRGELPPFIANYTGGDGVGVVYGDSPGYEGDHDLGLAYCVTIAEEPAPAFPCAEASCTAAPIPGTPWCGNHPVGSAQWLRSSAEAYRAE